jgi:hypothetical protein
MVLWFIVHMEGKVHYMCKFVLLSRLGSDHIMNARVMSTKFKVGVEVEKGDEDGLFSVYKRKCVQSCEGLYYRLSIHIIFYMNPIRLIKYTYFLLNPYTHTTIYYNWIQFLLIRKSPG